MYYRELTIVSNFMQEKHKGRMEEMKEGIREPGS
jgi:hypothetical protein